MTIFIFRVIGVEPGRHEREVVEAYASAGIDCLVLWEHEVLQDWELHRERIDAWIGRAMLDMNLSPIWRKG